MEWFTNELGKQLSEFAQDVLATDSEPDKAKNPDLPELSNSHTPSNQPHRPPSQGTTSAPEFSALRSSSSPRGNANIPRPTNFSQQTNSFVPFDQPSFAPQQRPASNLGSNARPNYSSPSPIKVNYSQRSAPQQPLVRPRPPVSQHISPNPKDQSKLYSRINELEIKNLQLEEQLKKVSVPFSVSNNQTGLLDKIKHLEAQLKNAYQEKLDSQKLQEEITKLSQESTRLKEEANSSKQEILTLNANFEKKLASLIEKHKQEIDSKLDAGSESVQNYNVLKKEFDDLKISHDNLSFNQESLKSELTVESRKSESFENELKRLREEKSSLTSEQIISLQNDKANLLDDINKLKDDAKFTKVKYELELKNLSSSLDDANDKIKKLDDKTHELKQLKDNMALKENKTDAIAIQSQMALEEKVAQLEKENEILRSSIQEGKTQLSTHLSEFNTEAEKLTEEKNVLAEKLKSISIRLKESELLVHEIESNKTSIANEYSALKNEFNEKLKANQDLLESNSSLTFDLSTSQQSIIALNNKTTTLSKDLQDANCKLCSSEKKIQDLASTKLDLETQLAKLESNNIDSAVKLSELENAKEKALQEARTLKEIFESLKSTKDQESKLLSDKLQQIELSLESCKKELDLEINKRELLESTNVELKNQNSNFQSDKSKLENQLKAQMESKGSDEATLKLFEDQLEESRKLLEETRDKLAQTITDSTSKLKTLEKEKVTLQSTISELEVKNNEYVKRLDLEKNLFSEKLTENGNAIDQLKNVLNKSNVTITSLEKQIKRYQKELQQEKIKSSKSLEVSRREFSDNLSSLQNQNSLLSKQIEDLLKEKDEADALILELKRFNDNTRNEFQRTTEELDNLKTTTQLSEKERRKEVELLNSQILSLQSSLESHKRDIDTLNQTKSDLDAQIQELVSLNTTLNSELSQSNHHLGELKNKLLSLEDRCLRLEEELGQKTSALLQAENDLSVCSGKLQKSLDSIKNEAVLHSKFVDDTNIQISALSASIETFKVSIVEKDREIADLLSELAVKTDSAEDSLKKLEALNVELDSLKSLSSFQEIELANLKKQLELSCNSQKNSDAELNELRAEKEKLVVSEASLKASVLSFENKLKESNAELESNQNKLHQTNQTLKDLAASSDSSAKEKDDLIASLQSELNNVQELLSTKEEAYTKLASQSEFELTQANNQHRLQAAELQQEIDDYVASIDKLKNIIQNLTAEKRSLLEDHDKLLDKVNLVKTTVKNKLKEQEDENLKLKTHISVLESAHSDLNKLFENLQFKHEELLDERNQLKSQMKTQVLDLEKLNSEILTLQNLSNQDRLGQETLLNEHIYRQKELAEQVKTLELKLQKESDVRNQKENALSTSQEDLSKTLEEFNQLRQEYDVAQNNLLKLQQVLEELQGAQVAEVNFAVEKLQRLADSQAQSITELEYRAATAEAKLIDYSQKAKQVDALIAETKAKGSEVLNLKKELARVNDQLIDVSKRLRRTGGGEDTVSREFLAGLFTRFANFPRGDPGKFEMLEIISAALRLSPEEQVEVGLVRETSQAHIYPSLRPQISSNKTPVSKIMSASNSTSLDPPFSPISQSSPSSKSSYQKQAEKNSDIGSI